MSDAAGSGKVTGAKTALVTGASSGIGYHTALGLASRGDTVLITGRDAQRGAAAAEAIAAAAGNARVAFLQADHTRVGANRDLGPAVASQLKRLGADERLDVLVNNVGGIFATRTLTADGYESTLALNFLAPYVVTRSVLPMLRASPAARCVNVISSVAWLARQLPGDLLDDAESSRSYVGIQAHGRAKLLNMAWTLSLARDLSGSVTVTAVNPGTAWTAMTQALTPEVVPSWRYFYPLARWFQKRGDAAKAAQVCVTLATDASPAEIDGQYMTERGKPGKIPANLADPAFQQKVTKLAEDLTQQAPTASV
jgi:NAD(P)-dependent dehydrogenase (short-subunit alcohol dehydrogenase family)